MQVSSINPMPRSDYHVVPMKGLWAIKAEANTTYSGIFETQLEATSYAVSLARMAATSVVIHNRRGVIRDVWSYDSYASKTNHDLSKEVK